MNKKIICFILLFIAICGAFLIRYVLQQKSTPEPPTPVLKLVEDRRTPLHIPHYLAAELGFFAEQNIEVQLSTLQPGEKAHHLLHNTKANIIIAGPAQALLAEPLLEQQPLILCGEIAQKSDAFLVAREQTADFQWGNVKGRTIICGTPTEDSSLVLEHILRKHDIAPNWHCNIVANLPAPLRPGAFKAGTGSFLVTEGLWAEMLVQQQAGEIVKSFADEIAPLPAAAYITSHSYLDSHPGEIQALINGLHKAQQWMQYHSTAEVIRLVEKYFPDYDPAILTSIINQYKGLKVWSTSPVIDKDSYQNMVSIAENAGELAKTVPYSKGVTNRYAQKSVKIVHYQPEQPKPQPGFNWPYIKSLFD